MATSPDRTRRTVALLGVTAAALAGCTSSSHPARPGTTVGRTAATTSTAARSSSGVAHPAAVTSYGGAALGRDAGPCPVALPATWRSALGAARLAPSAQVTHVPSVPLPDAGQLLSEADTASTSTISLTGSGARPGAAVATIHRAHRQGALSDASATHDHVAFVYSLVGGEQAQNRWALYLWDRSSHPARAVARNPVDGAGHPLTGGWVHPLLTGTALWWIQPARNAVGDAIGSAGSALMRYDLASGRTSTVYSGLATSLVAYRGDVLVTAPSAGAHVTRGRNPTLTVRAFDQRSGREVAAPAGLTAGADQPDWLVSDGDLVAWNTAQGAIRGWRAAWGRSIDLVPPFGSWPTGQHSSPPLGYPGYPRIVGHFLAWNSTASYLLDLRSDSFARLTVHHGGLEASGDRLMLWQYVSDQPPKRGQRLTITEWALDVTALPALPRCA